MITRINKGLLFVFLISLVPLINLLTPGLLVAHDSVDHVARISSFYTSLSEGNIIPRWGGNLNYGFGTPILMFLYPLPSYIASLFHFIGFSYVDSFKLVLGSSYVLSGIFMYLWLREFLEEKASILGAVLYLFAPYRFIDLYVRGALGEHVAFVFLPLVLLTVYKLNKIRPGQRVAKYYLGILFLALSFAGLILSHNAISLIFTPFIGFYILYLYFEKKSRLNLMLSFASLALGFLFSLFFWLPAFLEGKYTLRDIVTASAYSQRFVEIKSLLWGSWNFGQTGEFSVQIGIVQIFLTLLAIFLLFPLFKKNDKHRYLLLGTLLFLIISVFLMIGQSNFVWEIFTTLQKLQFPWRFLSLTTFCTALIGALFITKVNFKNKNIVIAILTLITIFITAGFWQAKEYRQFPENFFQSMYSGTTDTGESSPIWSIRRMEEKPNDSIEIIEGEGMIKKLSKRSNYHEYVVSTKEKIRVRENTLYFPGWKVYDNGKIVENIEFQDPKNRGVITFYLDPGTHDIILKFEETKLRKLSNYLTLASLVVFLSIPAVFYMLPKQKIGKFKW